MKTTACRRASTPLLGPRSRPALEAGPAHCRHQQRSARPDADIGCRGQPADVLRASVAGENYVTQRLRAANRWRSGRSTWPMLCSPAVSRAGCARSVCDAPPKPSFLRHRGVRPSSFLLAASVPRIQA
ncbi:MAG: hypothetical protein MZW92_05200 [Comamonadaceae bacterium]|nr:hypothetical protein [Comamonadaceae bacterium]